MSQKVLRAFTASMFALLGARDFISDSNVQSPSKLQEQSNGAVSPEGKIDFSRDVQPSSQSVAMSVTGRHSKWRASGSIKNRRLSESGQQGR
jgi:hypothetical protein